MNLTCNLYVDGEFEGKINSKKEVNIGKHGHVKGDVITHRLVVQGYVEGSVNAQKVEIKAAGRVNGTIESAELVIEAKGIFEGSSVVKNVQALPIKPELNKS
jgi:cytoskeletal protein CcmA (bactofilin family)